MEEYAMSVEQKIYENMITIPKEIIYIGNGMSSINSGVEEFPDNPPKPTLCDVVFSSGIRFNDVYLEWNQKSNQIKLFKNVEPLIEVINLPYYGGSCPTPENFPQYITWVGYNHVCTILGIDCAIINKEIQLTPLQQILKLSEHLNSRNP